MNPFEIRYNCVSLAYEILKSSHPDINDILQVAKKISDFIDNKPPSYKSSSENKIEKPVLVEKKTEKSGSQKINYAQIERILSNRKNDFKTFSKGIRLQSPTDSVLVPFVYKEWMEKIFFNIGRKKKTFFRNFRQDGTTTFLCALAYYIGVETNTDEIYDTDKKTQNIPILTNTYQSSNHILNTIEFIHANYIKALPRHVERTHFDKSKHQIVFGNGNVIKIFTSIPTGDDISFFFVDNCEWLSDDVYQDVMNYPDNMLLLSTNEIDSPIKWDSDKLSQVSIINELKK